jgi:ornithine cyclodeaminase
MIPVFEEAAIRRAITPAVAVRAVREAFEADGLGRTIVPSVINLRVPEPEGEFHIKTAYMRDLPHVAVKVASGFPANASRGLPSGSGLIALFDAATGLPVALLLDNGYLTDVRTGAAGAIAADHLASPDATVVGILGAGVQARHQVQCLREVRPVREVVAWNRTPERAERLCEQLRGDGIPARVGRDVEAVCRVARILVTATASREPLVRAEWLRPGMHVTALGSDSPGKQELDPRCAERADLFVVDRLSQCARFGELAHAIEAGALGEGEVHAELGEIVAGTRPGRTRADQLTIADLTGVGFQDTAIASAAFAALA